ncbi:MAG: hypothetical protein K2Y26_00100 [Gemmatimonadaceae bacterium]|nr:hypothetical protein [Gemmatimonadaceae bacterium]
MRDVTINDLAPLARLGLWALSRLRDGYTGDIDACDLQDQAATLGVIERVPAPKPCGEHCVCAEADADYCYIDTPATVAARKGLDAAAQAAGVRVVEVGE